MHDDSALVEARLERFLVERLRPALHASAMGLELTSWTVQGEPVSFDEAVSQRFDPFVVGTPWGRAWSTMWLRVTGVIPAVGDGRHAELLFDLGFDSAEPGFQAEGTVYRPDGSIVKAIEPRNAHVRLDGAAGDEFEFYLEAAANPDIAEGFRYFQPTSLGEWETAGDAPLYTFRQADVVVLDETVWELLQDVAVLRSLLHELPADSTRRAEIVRALERMIDTTDPEDVSGTASAARAEVALVLSHPASASAHRVHAVGHAHIDSAWLWPVRETQRKVARTFSNVLALQQEDADFAFAASSAQQYAWMKQFQPELFERMRLAVAEGRFVPAGGMWVESDTNMPGGEALARQFIHGKRFFLEEFGSGATRCVAAGFLRILRCAAADRQSGRIAVDADAEDVLERDERDAPSHVPLGRHRREPDLHPLPAGRHLQRAAHRRGTGQGGAAVRGEGAGEHVAGPVRLRRRRRRAEPRDAGRSCATALPGGVARGDAVDAAPFLRDGGG